MINWLIEYAPTDEIFFVQANDIDEVIETLQFNGFDPEECRILGKCSDEDAEQMGYDTY